MLVFQKSNIPIGVKIGLAIKNKAKTHCRKGHELPKFIHPSYGRRCQVCRKEMKQKVSAKEYADRKKNWWEKSNA